MSFLPCMLALAMSSASAPDDRAKTEARVLKNEAFQKIAEGSYGEGVELLRRAHQAVPHPTFLFNIAVVYDQWPGHCVESLAAFDEFFAACPDCKVRPTAETRFAKVKARCRSSIELSSRPSGAEVFVDAETRGLTPLRLELRPGRHQLRFQAEGFEPDARELSLDPGQDLELSVDLRALPTATSSPPSPAGRGLRVAGWSAIGLGAVGIGLGSAFIVLTNESVNEERALRNTTPVDPVAVVATRDQARDRAVLAYVFTGIGIAGVASGVVLHVLAGKKRASKVALGTDGRRVLLTGRF
ncbi:MAG: PEGA domain-containing protein [Myxococcota bacterium]